uniref:NADH-ubiquinone oxidoreductase chain 4 n=1 Tax=Trichuris suis TaxID=68888 RepID=I1E3C9_9BILA|nr:NADH dehydrogenase subunit 4 [Trichuris suis]ACY09658.1 NADH dehydrogenase subunit 4 [Trichuris suis]
MVNDKISFSKFDTFSFRYFFYLLINQGVFSEYWLHSKCAILFILYNNFTFMLIVYFLHNIFAYSAKIMYKTNFILFFYFMFIFFLWYYFYILCVFWVIHFTYFSHYLGLSKSTGTVNCCLLFTNLYFVVFFSANSYHFIYNWWLFNYSLSTYYCLLYCLIIYTAPFFYYNSNLSTPSMVTYSPCSSSRFSKNTTCQNLIKNSSMWYVSSMVMCVLFCTLLPFFIKIPIYLLHLWLPKAHVEAPVLGSMLLASILLKTGGYGMLKMCNMYVITFTKELISVFLFMVLMATMLCLLQSDLKKFVAYSSVTHMTMILILLFSEYISFENGSIFLMISHGVISNSLLFMVGVYSFSSLSRLLFKQDNIMMISPKLWYTCMIILFLNAGSPPSLSMISEMMLFINSHLVWSWNFIVCSVMFLLLVYYPIWLMSNMNSVKMNLSNNIYVCITDLLLLCYLPFSASILWLNSTTML